jgi:hypothetical protein
MLPDYTALCPSKQQLSYLATWEADMLRKNAVFAWIDDANKK